MTSAPRRRDPHEILPDRIVGAFLGLACGDALGAPAEFVPPAEMPERFPQGLTEMIGGGSFRWAPGEWTDDTAMALCVAEGLLDVPSDPVPSIGARFERWEENARDVGSTIRAAITAKRAGGRAITWAAAARSTPQARQGRAAGNGSLMRTLPVALTFPDRGRLRHHTAAISAMTHWDTAAETCCTIYCLWIRGLLRGRPLAAAWQLAIEETRALATGNSDEPAGRRAERAGLDRPQPRTGVTARDRQGEARDVPGLLAANDPLWARLARAGELGRQEVQPTGYAGSAMDCLEAAAWAVLGAGDAEQAIRRAVELGGEADTIGAVAGGAAGANWGFAALPSRWLRDLHRRDWIQEVACRLADLRHMLTYAPPGPPPFVRHDLGRGLAAGRNPLTELDARELAAAGITHVLDLREPREWESDDDPPGRPGTPRYGAEAVDALGRLGLVHLNVPVRDGEAPGDEQLTAAVAALHAVLGGAPDPLPVDQAADDTADPTKPVPRVYVHCRAGRERTGAVLVAYLAGHHGLTPAAALAALQRQDPGLDPLPWQREAVERWLARTP